MNKCIKYEFHLTSECKVIDECSCCHGNNVSIATRSLMNFYYPNDKCTKYEFHLASECKVIDECSCCHGNNVSIATRSLMNFYCPNEQTYQI